MASIDKFVSGHKLKTYGKASRNQTCTGTPNLQRRTTSNQPRDAFAPHERVPETAEETTAHKQEQRHQKQADTSKSYSAHSSKTPVRTPAPAPAARAKTSDGSVFDVPSSDDELHTSPELRRKRRKLSVPATMPVRAKRKELDDASIPERRRAQNATPSRPSSRSANRNVKTSPRGELDPQEVEVVVKTPREAKKMWDSVPTTQSHQRTAPLKHNGTVSNAVDDATTRRSSAGVERETPSSYSRQAPFATKQKRSTPPAAGGSPADKLRRMTEHLTSPPKPARAHNRHANNGPYTIGPHTTTKFDDGSTPGTPSRTRLVDALGSRQDAHSSDSGNTSDSSASSVPRRGARQSVSLSCSGSSARRAESLRPDSSQISSVPEQHSANQTHESQSHPRRAPATSQKVTYARQRSFLTDADLAGGDGSVDPLKQLASSSLTSDYAGGEKSRKRPQVSSKDKSSLSFEIDDDEDEGNATGVRSIYELRRAGSNARHQGFVETIFDDLEDETPLSCKRAGLLQLCSNLNDYQFAHRFLSSSLDQRLAKCTEDVTDLICGFLLACIYALLLSTTPASPIVLRTCSTQMSRIVPILLSEGRDIMEIAKQRGSKMSKDGLTMLRDVAAKIHAGKIWAEQKPKKLSPQVVALRCTELTIRRVRETGADREPITTPVLRQLVDLLLQQSSARDTELNDARGSNDLLVLELAFSILESYTVGLGQLESGQEVILRGLSQLGWLLAELAPQSGPLSRQIQGLEIRLVLNITNNNSRLCEDFSTPELVRGLANIILLNFGSVAEELAASEKKESVLDTVILALGALINLTEWSGAARRLIFEESSSSSGSEGSTTTLLDGLIELFSEGWEATAEVGLIPTAAYKCSIQSIAESSASLPFFAD